MTKERLGDILTWAVCILLVLSALGIGVVKSYTNEREELLLDCMEDHAETRDLRENVADCQADAEEFDEKLRHRLTGRVAALFGVEPISGQTEKLHAQLLRDAPEETGSSAVTDLIGQFGEMLDDHVDTDLSIGKVIWTCVLLSVIFGRKGRRKGFTLGKFLAGFGLFKMWRKD